jgi:hypothetical protein
MENFHCFDLSLDLTTKKYPQNLPKEFRMKKEKNANLEPVILWITLIWKKLAGIAEDAKYWTPRLALGLAIIAAICLIVEIFGIAFSNVGVMFFSSMILILTLLIGNFGAEVIAKVIGGVGSLTDETSKHSKELAENIKKLFNPLVFIALVVAFINAWAQMNGFEVFKAIYLYVIVAVVMVIALAFRKTRLPIFVMVAITCASATLWYADNSNDPVAAMLQSKIDVVKQWMGNNSLGDEANTAKKFGVAKDEIEKSYDVTIVKGKVTDVKEVSAIDTVLEKEIIPIAKDSNDSIETIASEETVPVKRIIKSVLLKGEMVQIISNKPVVYDGEKLIQVKLMNRTTHRFFNGRKTWIQPELLEIGNNVKVISGEGYSVVKSGGGWWIFKKPEIWQVYFQTDCEISFTTTEFQGKNVLITGFNEGELFWNNPGTGKMISYGSPETPVEKWKRGATKLKYKKGGMIKIIITA